MSRHSTSFEAERPAPAEVTQELLPADNKDEAATPVPLAAAPIARKGAIRRFLLAGTAVALLAGAAWYAVREGRRQAHRRALPGLDR